MSEHRSTENDALQHWCLKVSGETCPMPCAGGCDSVIPPTKSDREAS